jgi:hypothetical protein
MSPVNFSLVYKSKPQPFLSFRDGVTARRKARTANLKPGRCDSMPGGITMDYIPLLRVCDFLPFVAFLNKIGAPTDKLLHAAKVPTRALDQAEALIPMYPVNAFLERAMRTEGLPHLGALVGARLQSIASAPLAPWYSSRSHCTMPSRPPRAC